jgi:hypothetical protein
LGIIDYDASIDKTFMNSKMFPETCAQDFFLKSTLERNLNPFNFKLWISGGLIYVLRFGLNP